MKRLFILLAISLCTQNMSAQLFSKERVQNLQNFDKPRFSYGYILGLNFYDFNFDYNVPEDGDPYTEVIHDETMGFSVGLLGNMRISDHFDLRFEPMVTFSTRNLLFNSNDFEITDTFRSQREVKSTYVHLPLLLKISTKRINNIKPFIVGGLSTSLNLSSNEKNPDDNAAGQFRMKTNTNYYEIGFGIDLYLYYFKFTPSIRGVFAMSDELQRDNDPFSPWTSNIEKMSSRGIFLNFTFQ